MADMDELEITIDADGNVSIKVIGGKGGGCLELTREIEEALGVVSERKLTEGYYQEVEAEGEVQQESGQ